MWIHFIILRFLFSHASKANAEKQTISLPCKIFFLSSGLRETINYMKGKIWDAFRENLLKTKKARLSVPRFRTTRLTIINHVIRHICILNEKVLPLLVSRAQALHGQAVLLWKQDNPFQDFDADHFYDITSQHRDDNLGLFKKQWERNFFAATVGDCTALFAQCWRKA